MRHVPCFAHTLNLTASDVFELPDFNIIMKKCKDIAKYFHSSSVASDKLKAMQRSLNKAELKLIQQCPTRWNSSYAMLKRIFDTKQEITLTICECEKGPEALLAEEFTVIQDVINLLEPFDVATNTISGENYITISYIIPLIRGISLKLSKLEANLKSVVGKEMLNSLRESIKERLKPYEKRTPTILATILDPRFKKRGFKTDDAGSTAAQCLQSEYTTFLRTQKRTEEVLPEPEASTSTTSTMESPAPEVDTDHLELKSKSKELLFLFSSGEQTKRPIYRCPLSDAIIDIRQYLERPPISSDKCPIEYWSNSNLEFLKTFALSYLCIPATSVPSERIFSKAGLIHSEARNRLKPKRLNELLFLNQNAKYFMN